MKFRCLIILCISPFIAPGQVNDNIIFESCINNGSLTDIALCFIGKPYKPATLEINDTEQLVVNLREFDCTTLVESVIAMYLTKKETKPDFENFKKNLTKIRYRNNNINGYVSRLHYSSDWIINNEKKNILRDVTKDIGGEQTRFNINYMSLHYDKYPYLKKHPEYVIEIKDIEKEINANVFYYVPKSKINSVINKIQDGDVIFFVTTISGLDISHMGIAYTNKGLCTFIHASQKYKQVIINPESLNHYCTSSKTNKGIIICRIK